MQEYRAYILDAEGRLKDFIEFFVPDDEAAVAYAQENLDLHDVEVWLARIIAKLVPTAH